MKFPEKPMGKTNVEKCNRSPIDLSEVSTASNKGKPESERLKGGNDGENTPTSVRYTRERGGVKSPYATVNISFIYISFIYIKN
jgi:hypothetical protein